MISCNPVVEFRLWVRLERLPRETGFPASGKVASSTRSRNGTFPFPP
jgi:hypothetical protein